MTVTHTAFQSKILLAAARQAGVSLDRVLEHAYVRVSVNSIKECQAQLEATFEQFATHATLGAWLPKLRSAFGVPDLPEPERLRLGFHKVTEADLLNGHPSRTRVGWIALVPAGKDARGPALVMITVNSAIDRALTRSDGSEENAYALMLTQAWRACPYAHKARYIRFDRVGRHNQVTADIWAAYAGRLGCRVHVGQRVLDPKTDDWTIAIESKMAAKDADGGKEKTLAGIVQILRRGGWPLAERHLPCGVRLARSIDARTGQEKVSNQTPPACDDFGAELATTALRMLARGASATVVGYELALRGRRDGRGALAVFTMLPGLATSSVAAASLERLRTELVPGLPDLEARALLDAIQDVASHKGAVDAANKAAIEATRRIVQHLDFYRTGEWRWIQLGSIDMHTDYNGAAPRFPRADDEIVSDVVPDDIIVRHSELDADPGHPWHRQDDAWRSKAWKKGFFAGTSHWESPIELSTDEWAALDRVYREHPTWFRKRNVVAGGRIDVARAPLSRLSWLDGVTEHDGERVARRVSITLDHSAYQLWEGPDPDVIGENWSEVRKAWLRLPAAQLHRFLGKSMIEVARGMEASAPLPILVRSGGAERVTPLAAAQARVAQIEQTIEELEARAANLELEVADVGPQSRRYERIRRQIAETDKGLDALDVDLEEANADVATTATQPDSAPPTDATTMDADAHPLVALGVALTRLSKNAEHTCPSEMQAAVDWILEGGDNLRVRRGEGRLVEIDVHARVPSGDGLPVVLKVGTIRATRSDDGERGRPADGVDTLYDEAALRVLGEQAGQAFLERNGWSMSFLVEQLRDWLRKRNIAPGACNALIDAGLAEVVRFPAPAVMYAYLTAADQDKLRAARAAGADLNTPESVADTIVKVYTGNDWPRRATGFVRTDLTQLRDLVGLLDAQRGARGRRSEVAKMLGITARQLGFIVTDATDQLCGVRPFLVTPTTVGLPPCEAEGCARRGQPLTKVIAVPETLLAPTPAVLACQTCRTPAGWSTPLPAVYTEQDWNATGTIVNLSGGSHIVAAPSRRQTWPQMTGPLTAAAAARRLNLHVSTLNSMVDDGILPARAIHGSDRGGVLIEPEDLERDDVRSHAARLRRRKRAQQLKCRDCGVTWSRPPRGGRPPRRCPDCQAARAA